MEKGTPHLGRSNLDQTNTEQRERIGWARSAQADRRKRTLNRAGEGLFERVALSKDRAEILALANDGQRFESARDVGKDPYVFEFLDFRLYFGNNLPEILNTIQKLVFLFPTILKIFMCGH